MARSSAFEVVSIMTICQRRGLVAPEQYHDVYGLAEEISKMLSALKRKKEQG
ncbi:MAG TPA: four helix bundle protein [Candidatus Methylomirabilis sp.]